MSCSICQKRKEKRFCPAVHGRICPQCCGEQREVTLDCPSDCIYLQLAHQHEKPRVASELDPALLFPRIEIPEQFIYEQEHLIVGLSFALAKAARKDRSLNDSDLILALASMIRTYETYVNSGLHYQEPTTNMVHQAIVAETQQMIQEYREAEAKHLGQARLRDADVLRALTFLLRLGYSRTTGRPKSRAFVEFLFGQFPEKESVIAGAEEGSRLIVP